MPRTSIRILIVDDFEPWRRIVCSILQKRPELEVIAEASDGLEAIQKAQELQPHLILLDVGLPGLNGIEAAKRIRDDVPNSKILIVSHNCSRDIAEKALDMGAAGYVLKSAAASDLLSAVDAVLEGTRFVSPGLKGHALGDPAQGHKDSLSQFNKMGPTTAAQPVEVVHKHAACFYWDDQHLLDDAAEFVRPALTAGGAAIVIASEPHRRSLLLRLRACGVDAVAATAQGRYFELDAADTISSLIVDGVFDSTRFEETFGDIITAARAAKNDHSRVAIFGEGGQLLLERGDMNAVIRDESLCNEIIRRYDVDILCGYSRSVKSMQDDHIFQEICAEHSAVYLR